LLVKRYLINFFVWWYIVQAKELFKELANSWGFFLGYVNLLPMIQNLFVPLYQDYTLVGKLMSFPIRIVWIVIASFLVFLFTIPLLFIFVFFLAFPLLTIFQIIRIIINVFT